MSALTKEAIAERLTQKLNLPVAQAKELVELLVECIKGHLETGSTVKISGFGSWSVKEKKARPGRNPHSGETITIAARRVVVFHASDKLRDAVRRDDEQHRNEG